jgi:hypothetical protein
LFQGIVLVLQFIEALMQGVVVVSTAATPAGL